MKTFSEKMQLWSNPWNKHFFPYRRNQWQFSQTDEPSYCLRRSIHDYKLHIHVHRLPCSFLVCPIPQQSSAVSSERDSGKQQKLWSQKCERQRLPYCEIVSPGIRLSHVLLSSERHNIKGHEANCTNTSRAQVRYVVRLGTSNGGPLFSLTDSPLEHCYKIGKNKISCNWL